MLRELHLQRRRTRTTTYLCDLVDDDRHILHDVEMGIAAKAAANLADTYLFFDEGRTMDRSSEDSTFPIGYRAHHLQREGTSITPYQHLRRNAFAYIHLRCMFRKTGRVPLMQPAVVWNHRRQGAIFFAGCCYPRSAPIRHNSRWEPSQKELPN